jgi:diguanylate cyclase (GGDEF)-like protein
MARGKARLGGPFVWVVIGASLVLLGFVVLAIGLRDSKPEVSITIDDIAETLAAAWGAFGCASGAVRSVGRRRLAVGCLAAAAASWSIGQGIWTTYEVFLGVESPFPSLADVGYLGFLVFAVAGVWLLPPARRSGERRQQMLDAATVAIAIALVSSVTTLGAVLDAGGDSTLALAISVAYPAGDILLITATLLAMVTSSEHRLQLGIVTASMIAMTASDSAFAYLSAMGTYSTGSLVDVGWSVAFLGLGMAGVLVEPGRSRDVPLDRTMLSSLLPYVLTAIGGLAVLYQYFSRQSVETLTVLLSIALIGLVLFRQYLALWDNQQLNAAVAEREERLRHLAFHDDLTGLANRPLFFEKVTDALAAAPAGGERPSVAFIDLDGFKWVNDTLGHAVGDDLLVSVAHRLKAALGPDDTLARFGGDEFAVLFTGPHDPDTVAARLVESLRTPFHVAGQRMRVSASIGVARLEPQQSAEAGTLLQRADIAMFMAKRTGKDNYQQYTSGMGLEAVDDLTLQHALAKALDAGEIGVAYQPVVNLRTGRLHGLEALARWQYQGIVVSPETFVPTAERIGRAGQLTAHILETACRQVTAWSAAVGHRQLTVAVNITPGELADPTLPDRVAATLRRVGMDGSQLTLEVTESGLLGDPQAIQTVLARLRELNVSLSLDDFGTGYNTLAQLLSVRLDAVKIDRVFIQDIDTDPHRRAFLEAMLMLLDRLGLTTVAEGIERPEQAELLRGMNCTMAQGFLLGRPATAEQITGFVLAEGTRPQLPAPRGPSEPHPKRRAYRQDDVAVTGQPGGS